MVVSQLQTRIFLPPSFIDAPAPGLNWTAQPCQHPPPAVPRGGAKIKQKGKAVLRFLAVSLVVCLAGALGAGPAFAAETCDQAFKDTSAGSKSAIIAPKETAKVA